MANTKKICNDCCCMLKSELIHCDKCDVYVCVHCIDEHNMLLHLNDTTNDEYILGICIEKEDDDTVYH